ncbi:hypothetical protein AWN76_005540 [Rhodothermaceae bacterium RA]|nr:hypothetical protein AWN76_005540 [Rhodothermaceae bacterium RA]
MPTSTTPLSRTELEVHLQAMRRQAVAVPVEALRHHPIGCVDGRNPACVVGAPGGDAGLFVLLLATLERFRHSPLAQADVDRLFEAYLDAFGHFYLHTDTHALAALHEAMRRLPALAPRADALTTPAEVEAFLRHPPETTRPALLRLLTEPAAVGCGHLRLMLEHPTAYHVRPDLLRAVLERYYVTLWAGDDRLTFDVLPGEHRERAVVNVHTSRGPHPPVVLQCPQFGAYQLFVHHPEAVAYLRRQHVRFLEDLGLLTPAEATAFAALQEETAAAHLQATLRFLAPDLPVYDVDVSPEALHLR